MKEKSTTVRHSLSEIKALQRRSEHGIPVDAPEADALGADFWKSARIVAPIGKTPVHLRIDSDVVEWFRS